MQPVLIVTIVLGALGALGLTWAIASLQVIPQASTAVVERYGRYARTLSPGVNFVIPFIDSIRNRIDMREQVVPFPPQPVITQDNLVVNIDYVVYYRVTDAQAATYEVASYIHAMEQLTITTLRNIMGGMDLERTLTSREEINSALRGVLEEATGRWGILVNKVELKAIEPPTSIQDSLEKQMRADRDKRAAIITAEGIRQAAILKAAGEREAAKLKAQSDVEVAEILAGNAESVRSTPPERFFPELQSTHKPLRPGDPRALGRYRLTARLGHGGMGTVFLGRSPGERLVAVKVIQDDYVDDPTFRKRFEKEISAVRKVGGFHTASVVDADPEGSPPWLATEYVPGPSLHYVLTNVGPLPMPTVRTLAVGVAEALEGIHSCGIVHRDLKPGNIVVSGTGPRVIDFGLARVLEDSHITLAHQVVGTPVYLAPEQLNGTAITPAADLYAFGMVLCHAAGVMPLKQGQTLTAALESLPGRLAAVITRCLQKNPDDRPTPAEVINALSPDLSPSEDWLSPHLRALVDLHNRPAASAT